jgi:SAM-dependent methyltransferase
VSSPPDPSDVPPAALLDEEQLAAHAVVANTTMNRERGLAGANSYERELGFDPVELLLGRRRARAGEHVTWVDLCCGEGRALVEAAQRLEAAGIGSGATIVGVDLVDGFDPRAAQLPCVQLVTSPLADWAPSWQVDLVTCVHGLHYVGDKLGLLARAAGWLLPHTRLVADLDLASIRVVGGATTRSIAAMLRAAGFEYDFRRHQVSLEGAAAPRFPLTFLGADPGAGPNHTGQPGVDSWYAPAPH